MITLAVFVGRSIIFSKMTIVSFWKMIDCECWYFLVISAISVQISFVPHFYTNVRGWSPGMVPQFIFICDFSNLIQSFITNDESRDMVVIYYLFNGNSWSISPVCCWCNDTYYVLLGLYDDFSCWLSFARLARIYPLYCCCDCYFIFYISILSGVIQVCSIFKHKSLQMRSSRPIMTKIRSFVCELDLWSFLGI